MARCINKYSRPIKKRHILWWTYDSPSHEGRFKHSIDLYCREGTPVYATADGIVVWVNDNAKIGGPYRKYFNLGNRIVIRHKNDEYTAYEHLRYKGSKVRVGDRVKRKQQIAYSGNTGYSFGPHLHFEVFTAPLKDLSEGTTLEVPLKLPKRKYKPSGGSRGFVEEFFRLNP